MNKDTDMKMQERILQSLQTGPCLSSSETLRIIERLNKLETDKAELVEGLEDAAADLKYCAEELDHEIALAEARKLIAKHRSES